MTVTLYRIPELRANKPNTVSFGTIIARTNFFNRVPIKLTISNEDSTVGRIKDLGKLYQELTVFTNGRNPYTSYNYACINNAGKDYYYFITNFREIGDSQVVYSLKKDTLITYATVESGADVDISQFKALVTREHKPRFNYANNRVLYHRIPEPNDTSTPYIHSQTTITTPARRARFVYKNRTDSKPVAYLYTETATVVNVVGADWIGTIYSSIPTSSPPHEEMYTWDGNFQYKVGSGTPNISVSVPSTQFVKYERSALGTRHVNAYNKSNGTQVGNLFNIPAGRDLKIKVGNQSVQRLIVAPQYIELGTTWATIVANYTTINYAATSQKTLPLFEDIDTYDAATDRIVEIPYFPISDITFYEDGYGIFIPLETKVLEEKTVTLNNPYPYNMTKADQLHQVGNDPKLYTSQFSPIIVTMNGMSQGLKRELIGDPEVGIPENIQFFWDFHLETLFPSVFNTKITFSVTPFHPYDQEEANELLKSWTVNNEVASVKDELYSYNQYYKDLDDKQRQVQESAAFRNTSLNLVNQALGITGGMIAGGTPNPVQFATRAGQATINIAQSFMDLQDQLKMNTIQAKQKYTSMLLASSQISGAPLNFIKYYAGDRVSFITYKLKGHDLLYWDQVFHKFGYTTLEYKNPTLITRKYWDYKKMIIDELSSPIVTDECVEDIKLRFAEGVTIYHSNSRLVGGTIEYFIEWTQSQENWEI